MLRDALGGHKPARLPGLPPFTAGAVGFFAYDAVRQIERLPALAKDELGVPDACLLFFDEVLAFDHVRKEIWLVVTADVRSGNAAAATIAPSSASTSWRNALRSLCRPWSAGKPQTHGKLKVKHRTAKKDFMAAVARTKEYIRGGDAFQVVISQRFDVEPGVDSFQVYRALRTVNPEPIYVFPALRTRWAARRETNRQANPSSKKSKGAETLELGRFIA